MSTDSSSGNLAREQVSLASERWVIVFLYLSALAAAIGIVFLILFFSGIGGFFGTMNDIAVVIHYTLLLPIITYVHRILAPSTGRKIQTLGMAGTFAVIVLQSLLVANVLPFQRQIVLVIPAFLLVTAWFAITEQAGRDQPRLPKGQALAVLAGLVFGYPFWALSFIRRIQDVRHSHALERKFIQ